MAFRKPITTLGGLLWWKNIKQSKHFLLQEHKVGLPVWPYKYRIVMRENRMEIANANDPEEIDLDWDYLKDNVVPQMDEMIDVGKAISEIEVVNLINKVIKKL